MQGLISEEAYNWEKKKLIETGFSVTANKALKQHNKMNSKEGKTEGGPITGCALQ